MAYSLHALEKTEQIVKSRPSLERTTVVFYYYFTFRQLYKCLKRRINPQRNKTMISRLLRYLLFQTDYKHLKITYLNLICQRQWLRIHRISNWHLQRKNFLEIFVCSRKTFFSRFEGKLQYVAANILIEPGNYVLLHMCECSQLEIIHICLCHKSVRKVSLLENGLQSTHPLINKTYNFCHKSLKEITTFSSSSQYC